MHMERRVRVETQCQTPIVPQAGEMVLAGKRPGCITRVIGAFNGRWWVETSAAPYALIQGMLHDSGRTRMWMVRPFAES